MLYDLSKLGKLCLLGDFVDFRKGLFGLHYILHEQGYANHQIGDIYIFHSRDRKSLKMLCFGEYGFELLHRKVNSGRYGIPNTLIKNHNISIDDFKRLLSGYSILEEGFSACERFVIC
jgi:hypothetical protein